MIAFPSAPNAARFIGLEVIWNDFDYNWKASSTRIWKEGRHSMPDRVSPDSSCRVDKCGAGAAGTIQDLTIKSTLDRIKHKLIVMSGKGGVGKSSIAANLAVALSQRDLKVGLMDVDFHGPSIAGIMGLAGLLDVAAGGFAEPKAFSQNLGVVSMASLLKEKDQAVVWRGPAKTGAIRKFISDVRWDYRDYLIVDSPPGTGDEPLTVAQTIPDAKAVIVTTPQEVALGDVRKSINFCRHIHIEILGLIENMGEFNCPQCGKPVALFKKGGGQTTAASMNVPFLGTLPFWQDMVRACDQGKPVMKNAGNNKFYHAFEQIVEHILQGTGK
jgi:ATP-binding protein involved in chromosome partitioning